MVSNVGKALTHYRANIFIRFNAAGPFLYPLKTSENRSCPNFQFLIKIFNRLSIGGYCIVEPTINCKNACITLQYK